MGFPGGSSSKELTCNEGIIGDTDSVSELGRSPGGRKGNSLQYSCLENPMDRGAWQATVHGVAKSWTQLKQLSRQALIPNTVLTMTMSVDPGNPHYNPER